MKPLSKAKIEQLVNQWNAQYAPGIEVELTDDFGVVARTKTRSIAWQLGDGTPVVLVEGRTGGYLLDRIKPVPEEKKP